jgi:hypothetical protein
MLVSGGLLIYYATQELAAEYSIYCKCPRSNYILPYACVFTIHEACFVVSHAPDRARRGGVIRDRYYCHWRLRKPGGRAVKRPGEVGSMVGLR